ncbi:hypothetical protein BDV96DRAFT_597677 [Lophiotrema nucula]|uniref:BTB domain-containing protein n=1 Tax=Lophiotrema nucula TaxID=690887 RepID=A0A6A5ZFU0_9PLEO|nr:hypothetical protein BDV96DRAFT_597677 [Lophiotrema nucula]
MTPAVETEETAASALAKAPIMSMAVRKGAEGLVNVKIGPDKTEYLLHRCFLIHHSEYFRKALQGDWKEAQDNEIVLEDVETGTFNVFVNWVYTRKLPKQDSD